MANTSYGEVECLPFDIRPNRISVFRLDKEASNEEKIKIQGQFEELLKKAIKLIIDDYDNILARFKKDDYKNHDLEKFKNFSLLCEERALYSHVEKIVDYRSYTYDDMLFWSELQYFFKLEENRFILDSLNKHIDVFLKSMLEFGRHCSSIMNFDSAWNREDPDKKPIYSMFDKPREDESSEAFSKRFHEKLEKLEELANQSKEAYRIFRREVKKELSY